MINFSQRLHELLDENNLSVEELSSKLSISKQIIYKYLKEEKTPTIRSLVKFANYFNCTLDFIVGLDDCTDSYYFKKDYDKNVFYERYLELLKRNRLTNYQLCRNINIAESCHEQWEKGSLPYTITFVKLAKYFGVSIDYLIGRSDE